MKKNKEISICHLSDLHLGYRRYNRIAKNGQNQREADVNQAFKECISKIINLKPDLAIIAGDLFHHVRPTNSILSFCFREIRRLAQTSEIPVIIVAGNHEFPKRLETGCALNILSEIDNVYVADNRSEKFNFPDLSLSVTCLPQPSLIDIEKNLIRADDRFKFNILALHAQLGGQAISDFGGIEINLKSLSPYEWDYIALGHLHEMKQVALNACYSGAIEHTAANIWAQPQRNKGFLQVFLPSGKRIFHSLSSPREALILPIINAEGMEAEQVMEEIDARLSAVAGGIDGKLIRLEIVNIPRQIQAGLNHKKLREYRLKTLHLSIDMKPPLSYSIPAHLKLQGPKRLHEELSVFCDSLNESFTSKEGIKNLLLTYLKKLEEKNEIAKLEP